MLFVSGVVSNDGQFPQAIKEAGTYLSTGPMCRFAGDLLPMLKVMVKPQERDQLRLDDKVKAIIFPLDILKDIFYLLRTHMIKDYVIFFKGGFEESTRVLPRG